MGFRQPLAPDLDQFCSNVQEALKLALNSQQESCKTTTSTSGQKYKNTDNMERSRFLVKSEQKTKQQIQKGKLIKFTQQN